MKRQTAILRYFIYFSVLLIGIIIGIAIRHYRNMSLMEEINLIDLAALVVTVFLAVYVPEVLDRKLQKTRDKKDIVESRIFEFQAFQKKINLLVQGSPVLSLSSYLEMKSLLDIAERKFETIEMLFAHAGFEKTFERELRHLKSLTDEHKALLDSLNTDEPSLSFPSETVSREEFLYTELDKASSLLLFAISDVD